MTNEEFEARLANIDLRLEVIAKRLHAWRDRIEMYKDKSFLQEGQVLHELEAIKSHVKDAKKSCIVD